MFHKILLVSVVLCLVGLGFFMSSFSRTSTLLNKYRQYGAISSDMHYEKVEKNWGEQGLIFYQVEFSNLNVPHHVDRMFVSADNEKLKMRLEGVKLNVKQAMQKLYDSSGIDSLNEYVPYQDFFDRLLTSLSIMGIDEFVGDILVNTAFSDLKTMDFDVQVNQEKKATMKLSGVIHVPVLGADKLSALKQGNLSELNIQILDKRKLEHYINYAKSLKRKIPENFQRGVFSLKNLSQKLPDLSDWMH